MSRYEEIHGQIVRLLAAALYVDVAEVKPAATLQSDLGAESIDFLDIVFRLECEFGIQIPEGELFPESMLRDDPELVQNGSLTEKGLGELRSRMPYMDLDGLTQDRRLGTVSELFTVGLLTRYVAWKLGQSAGAGPSACGADPAFACSSNVGHTGENPW